ncbi:MAG: Asp-tRNA(Asn)/Glu-tRNA(Gln) amidotransferase subunit GatA [Candidatus Zixiibacteriota bacterium]|nr:MAG: Asp-tRNA(Asn)/Glu-tRNA(Gln) amidotransferase subunit GatA [candidate division Zixibacteria bacterium]
MPDYQQLTAVEIVSLVSQGEVSAVEITREALQLAEAEGEPLNAFITLCKDRALEQAVAIDKRVRDDMADGLPLLGVPVSIKDNLCYRDYPTTCGSHILEDYNPPYDATAVSRLIKAGAVIIGKTNMDEFAMGSSSETSYFGVVKNPLDQSLTAGGSSGGSAAVVAQGIVPVALGSETGGSVRQPASFCGLYGLKPTYGSVSRYGLVAYCSSTDVVSPFARDVYDLALIFDVICGEDNNDATSISFDRVDYVKDAESNRKYRIGMVKEHYVEGLDPQVESVVREAASKLERDGHTIVEISLPSGKYAVAMHYIIAPAEASTNLARYDGVRYGLREAGDRELDEMYAATREAGFGREVKRRIMLGTYVLASGYYDRYYVKAMEVRELMRREFEEVFKEVDLLISPTAPTPAFKLGEKTHDPLAMYLSDIYTIPASQTGVPALSVPFGQAEDGRPIGVQFTAPWLDELSLFRIAHRLDHLG